MTALCALAADVQHRLQLVERGDYLGIASTRPSVVADEGESRSRDKSACRELWNKRGIIGQFKAPVLTENRAYRARDAADAIFLNPELIFPLACAVCSCIEFTPFLNAALLRDKSIPIVPTLSAIFSPPLFLKKA